MENSKTKKKSSTLIKDAIALFLITLISGLALSSIFEITKEPIKLRKEADKVAAYQAVYLDAASFEYDKELMSNAEGLNLTELNKEYNGITIDEINKAIDADKNMIGYVIKVSTTQGYKDVITLAIGYSKEGMVTGIETLAINETAGLGMNAKNPEFKKQFANKKVDAFTVTKIGAKEDNEINAISGATITTRAVSNAVNAGIGFIKEYSKELGGGAVE